MQRRLEVRARRMQGAASPPMGSVRGDLREPQACRGGPEDARFLDHEGFDWQAIHEAMAKNDRRGKVVGGASTISQQLAKNCSSRRERSLAAQGAGGGHHLDDGARHGPTAHPRALLTSPSGATGYSARSRGRYHFGVPAAALAPEQAAWLAAILPSPRTYKRGASAAIRSSGADLFERCRARNSLSGGLLLAMPRRSPASRSEDLQKQLGGSRTCCAATRWSRTWSAADMPKHDLVEQLVHKQNLAEVRAKLDRAAGRRHRLFMGRRLARPSPHERRAPRRDSAGSRPIADRHPDEDPTRCAIDKSRRDPLEAGRRDRLEAEGHVRLCSRSSLARTSARFCFVHELLDQVGLGHVLPADQVLDHLVAAQQVLDLAQLLREVLDLEAG